MKKFIIVIVFVFLIVILISFNYLLWDREKQLADYQDLKNAKNLSIDTLGEKINNLDQLNKELSGRINSLTSENTTLKENFTALNDENLKIKQQISLQKTLISMLKSNLNTQPIEDIIKKWVEAVNSKNYKNAQALISKTSNDENLVNPEKFKTVYQNEIKSIRIKSAALFTELTDEEHIGKIQFKVVLEVEKPDAAEANKDTGTQELYKGGENERYITMDLDEETGEWRISGMADKP